jgi:hypothetical protein
MKIVVVAAAAALVFSSAAWAQTSTAAPAAVTSQCGATPELPNLPDGANATREQMTRANDRFNEWNAAARAVIECRHNEAAAVQAQWQALVNEHNAMVESVNNANNTWRTEADEFNTRSANRNERQLRQPSVNGG